MLPSGSTTHRYFRDGSSAGSGSPGRTVCISAGFWYGTSEARKVAAGDGSPVRATVSAFGGGGAGARGGGNSLRPRFDPKIPPANDPRNPPTTDPMRDP